MQFSSPGGSSRWQFPVKYADIGNQTGTRFPIDIEGYEAVASAGIILYLSGVWPNVCVEAGHALGRRQQNWLVCTVQLTNPNKAVTLSPQHVTNHSRTLEIRHKLKPHILTFLERAAAESRSHLLSSSLLYLMRNVGLSSNSVFPRS